MAGTEARAPLGTSATARLPRAVSAFLADRWLMLIAVAVVLRFAFVALIMGTHIADRNGWHFGSEDQTYYWGLAWALSEGRLADLTTTLGYSLLIFPFTLGTDFATQAAPGIGIAQLIVTLPLAYLLFRAGERLLTRRAAALGTALWLVSPILLSLLFTPSYLEFLGLAANWVGLQIAVDPISGFLAIAVIAAAAGAVDDASARRGALVGSVAGLAFLLRPSNAVIVLSALVALAAWRRWRALAAASAAVAVAISPQLVFNYRLYGDATKFAIYEEFADKWDVVSIAHVPRVFGNLIVSNWTGPLLLLGVAWALFATWQRFPNARWLVVGQAVGVVLFFSTVYYAISHSFVRYLAVAYPAFSLAIGAATVGRRYEPRTLPPARTPGPVTTGLVALALAGAIGLAVWSAQAPVGAWRPTVASLAPVADVEGPVVRLRWNAPEAPAALTYQIARKRSPAGEAVRVIGVPAGTETLDRPGPGVWFYTVRITPGSTESGWPPGNAMGESFDVRVVMSDPTRVPAE